MKKNFLEKKELPKATEMGKIDIRAYFETLYDKDTEKKKIEEAVNEISGEVTEISEDNEIKPENDNDEEEKISGENI